MRKSRVQGSGFKILVIAFVLTVLDPVRADNVGIATARLLETSTGTYVLEVDSSAMLLSAFSAPVLPERFQKSLETSYDKQGAFILIKYSFNCPDQPLTSDDELLLQWGQMGVSLTAQWEDGSFQQSLFLRRLDGIPVPIRLLKHVEIPLTMVLKQQLLAGLKTGVTQVNSWLFMLCLAVLFTKQKWAPFLLAIISGLILSLILKDLNTPLPPHNFCPSLIALGCVFLARTTLKEKYVYGLILGLVFVMGLSPQVEPSINPTHHLAATFMHQVGWMSALLFGAIVLSMVMRLPRMNKMGLYTVGSLAVTFTIAHFVNGFTPILESSHRMLERVTAAQVALPGVTNNMMSGGVRPKPKTQLDEPLAAFMTIEPYETRLEILVRVQDTATWPKTSLLVDPLPIEAQTSYQETIGQLLQDHLQLTQNGSTVSPSIVNYSFVTMTANGIYNRPEPILEPLNEAILGVTFIYSHDGLPNDTQIKWTFFEDLTTLNFTTTDPFGSRQAVISQDNPTLTWKNKLVGYKPPEIKPVTLVIPQWPLLSLSLIIIGGGLCWRIPKPSTNRIVVLLLIISYGAYPFFRTPVSWGMSTILKPSYEEAASLVDTLLTNVYRSFDYRQEETVYDRLAITVTGDQLTDIYLQSRRALELENRGGARGRVDKVDVLDVFAINKAPHGAFTIDVQWKVSGSVSHFGHTHYRQNLNRAEVSIVPVDNTWQIRDIKILDEERLL